MDGPTGWPGSPPEPIATRLDLVRELDRLRRRGARGHQKVRLSLLDIAKATGIPKSSLANYLSGRTFVPADHLDRIVLALGAASDELPRWATLWERVADHERRHGTAARAEESAERSAEALAVAPAMVGRAREVALLDARLAAAREGTGGAVFVEGVPGIGKSVLLQVAAAHAQALGCLTLRAVCDELSQAFALLPLLEVLDRDRPGPTGRPSAAGPELPSDGVDQVAATAERLLTRVERLCAGHTVVLFVDDVQWADEMTVLTLGRLVRMSRRYPLVLVVAARTVPSREDLGALRRTIGRPDRLTLEPLPPPDVAELIGEVLGDEPGESLLAMAAGASGNPLYLVELVHALRRAGCLTSRDGRLEVLDSRAPGSLAASIADRLSFLAPAVRTMLQTAALVGQEFTIPELAMVARVPAGTVLPLVQEAMDADVLMDSGYGIAFRHPLIRDALYQALSPSVRQVGHREAARALIGAGEPADRVARQLLAALSEQPAASVEGGWLRGWLATDGHALVARAPGVAIRLLRHALETSTTDHFRGALTTLLADALYRTGDPAAAEQLAKRELPKTTDPGQVVHLQWILVQCRAASGRYTESLAELDSALRSPGIQARERGRLLVLTARVHLARGRMEAAERIAGEGLDVGVRADDTWSMAWALNVLTTIRLEQGRVSSALPLFERALAVASRDPALVDLRLLLNINLSVALGTVGRPDDALRAATEVRDIAIREGNVVRRTQAHCALTELLFDFGRWDEALAEARAAAEVAVVKIPVVECAIHGTAALIRLHRGDPGAHEDLANAERVSLRLRGRLVASMVRARGLDLELRQSPQAAFEVLMASVTEAQADQSELIHLLADAVRLAMVVGDKDAAGRVAARAGRLAARAGTAYLRAVALHCRGLVERDPRVLLEAAAVYRDSDRRFGCAQALEATGEAVAVGGGSSAVAGHLSAARRLYLDLGASVDLARVDARAETFGVGLER